MSKSDSSKKTVLITGCSDGGIGAALARSFRDRGFHVFATLRNTAKAGSLAESDDVDILELEVTSRESIDRCAETVSKYTCGRGLDVLVNNAGADYVVPLLDTSVDEGRRLFDLNVWSILSMSQAFAPLLIQAHGTICNISSIAGVMPLAWSGTYSLTAKICHVVDNPHKHQKASTAAPRSQPNKSARRCAWSSPRWACAW